MLYCTPPPPISTAPLSHHQRDVYCADDITLAQATPTGVVTEEVQLCLCIGELAGVLTVLNKLESQFTARNMATQSGTTSIADGLVPLLHPFPLLR